MPTKELGFELPSLMPPTEFSRRGFLTTSLIAGFTLATGPVNAQSVITTDTSGLTAGEVKIPVRDGQVPAYRAMPATGGPFPTVSTSSRPSTRSASGSPSSSPRWKRAVAPSTR